MRNKIRTGDGTAAEKLFHRFLVSMIPPAQSARANRNNFDCGSSIQRSVCTARVSRTETVPICQGPKKNPWYNCHIWRALQMAQCAATHGSRRRRVLVVAVSFCSASVPWYVEAKCLRYSAETVALPPCQILFS